MLLKPAQFRSPILINKHIKLILALALIAICLAAPAGALAEEAAFSDLSVDNSSYPYIKYLVNKNIISGYPDGTFRPVSGITRAETAAMLVKASGLAPTSPPAATFTDMGAGHWAYGVVEAAAAAGLMNGYPDGSFRPDTEVTRAETAALLFNLTSSPLPVVALPPAVQDVGENHWARNIIAAALAAGLLETVEENNFAPDVTAPRSQVARGLALMMTTSPDRPGLELEGSLVAVKGEVLVKRDGEFENITGTTSCGEGAVIKTGVSGVAELNFSDGSGLRLEPDTEIAIKEIQGKAAILKDGTPGAYVDYLEIQLDRGRMFGALAYGYIFKQEESVKKTAFNNSPAGGRLLASTGLLPLAVTLAENEAPWWETASDTQVRVKVDMPWGVAGVRGTIWMNDVMSNKAVTTVSDGAVELTASGETVTVPEGYSSTIASPPSSPRRMNSEERAAWKQVSGWVQGRALAIQNGILFTPPEIEDQIEDSVEDSTSEQGGSNSSGGSSGGGGTAPQAISTYPGSGQTGVAPDSIISITFQDSIQAGNNLNYVTIVDENDDPVGFNVEINGKVLKLTPTGPLKNSWPVEGDIRVKFNTSLVDNANITVQLAGGPGTVGPGTASGIYLTASYSGLDPGSSYTLTIPSGEVESSQDGTVNEEITWSFTTASN
ncbi:MAG: hypothetical protein JL50_01755 [Peptococcaceae bacterium BICA1-7]|nr:MAG: hypothetical protein JL50_01755 [Peptococcaceae bacterium BICA1-7]HBV96255.1 hypothetical protein [Desulfotomaculum sp.]